MKIKFFILFSMVFSLYSFSQEIDSLNVLKSNVWKLTPNWVKKDTFSLISKNAIKKALKEYELTDEEIKILMRKNYGSYISFNSIGKVTVSKNFISCPVGVTFYNISRFKFYGNKVEIKYTRKPWKEKSKTFTKKYSIIRWDNEYIVLKKE